ncbi:MAG: pyridoxal-phosphate dependent enzyme, partial [Candidatus Omnitrophica bacterium]|nr:pyridoxal-phosphate dependent enzyme [Candidatus Omnitrophota bacterium]
MAEAARIYRKNPKAAEAFRYLSSAYIAAVKRAKENGRIGYRGPADEFAVAQHRQGNPWNIPQEVFDSLLEELGYSPAMRRWIIEETIFHESFPEHDLAIAAQAQRFAENPRGEILEIDEVEWNPDVSLTPELRAKIMAVATWRMKPDFAKSRSGYIGPDAPIGVNVCKNGIQKRAMVAVIKIKDMGDFSDPQHPRKPGEGDYLQDEESPEIHAEIDAELNLHPKIIPPIPLGGERYSYVLREYRSYREAFYGGADVGVPIAVMRYKNRSYRGEPLGVLVLGCMDKEDRRFGDIFVDSQLIINQGGGMVPTAIVVPGRYLLELRPQWHSNSSDLAYLMQGFEAWADSLRKLDNVGVIQPSPHAFNISWVGSTMYFGDFPETYLKRNFSAQQAFLMQLTLPLAQVMAGIEFLLLMTPLGNAFLEIDLNPYKVFLARYFQDIYARESGILDAFAKVLFIKAQRAYFLIGQGQPLSKAHYQKERNITVMLTCLELFNSLGKIAGSCGIAKPYSVEEFAKRYAAYQGEVVTIVNAYRAQRGMSPVQPIPLDEYLSRPPTTRYNEGGVDFADSAFTRMPDFRDISTNEIACVFRVIETIFYRVNYQQARAWKTDTIITGMRMAEFSACLFPSSGINREGLVLVNTNFVKLVALLLRNNNQGINSFIEELISAIAYHEITGHFQKRGNRFIFIEDELQAQPQRGPDDPEQCYRNIKALLFYWLVLAEGAGPEDIQKRFEEFKLQGNVRALLSGMPLVRESDLALGLLRMCDEFSQYLPAADAYRHTGTTKQTVSNILRSGRLNSQAMAAATIDWNRLISDFLSRYSYLFSISAMRQSLQIRDAVFNVVIAPEGQAQVAPKELGEEVAIPGKGAIECCSEQGPPRKYSYRVFRLSGGMTYSDADSQFFFNEGDLSCSPVPAIMACIDLEDRHIGPNSAEETFQIDLPLKGMHARPAAVIVKVSTEIFNEFGVYVYVRRYHDKNKIMVSALETLNLFGLCLGRTDYVQMIVFGDQDKTFLRRILDIQKELWRSPGFLQEGNADEYVQRVRALKVDMTLKECGAPESFWEEVAQAPEWLKNYTRQPLDFVTWEGGIGGLVTDILDLGMQPSGSFKPWLCYGLLKAIRQNTRISLVISATTGNQGVALSEVVRRLREQGNDIKARIYVSKEAGLNKIIAMEANGAEVRRGNSQKGIFENYEDAAEAARQDAQQLGESAYFVEHAGWDALIGYTALGDLALRQLKDRGCDLSRLAVIIPLGAGGLSSGFAIAAKRIDPRIRIILAQTERTRHGWESLRQGRLIEYRAPGQNEGFIENGIDTKQLEELGFQILSRLVDEVVLVDHEYVPEVIRAYDQRQIVIEGAGALPHLAAQNLAEELRRKEGVTRCLLVATGRNRNNQELNNLICKPLFQKITAFPVIRRLVKNQWFVITTLIMALGIVAAWIQTGPVFPVILLFCGVTGAGDRLLASRYEKKYFVNERTALQIRDYLTQYLDLDENSIGKPNFSYPIHSLYLDSPDLKCYYDTKEGNKNRFKLRVRYYDGNPDSPAHFEVK